MSKTRKSDHPKYQRQLPYKVKSQEEDRINIAYTNITAEKKEGVTFKPVGGVTYLWVYINGQIIIGIENAWLYPQAFININDPEQIQHFEQIIRPQLIEASSLGHVTLSCLFSQAAKDRGIAQPHGGAAIIGGELKFENGKWIANNQSGRFGLLVNTPKSVQLLMHEVAEEFEFAMDIKPDIRVSLPGATYLNELYNIWEKGNTDAERALLVLDDYAKSSTELFFSGIWSDNNYNIVKVKELLAMLKNDPTLTVDKILQSFVILLDGGVVEKNRYLVRRLKFIAGQTNHDFKLNEAVKKHHIAEPKI